jgi:hypothetical protein
MAATACAPQFETAATTKGVAEISLAFPPWHGQRQTWPNSWTNRTAFAVTPNPKFTTAIHDPNRIYPLTSSRDEQWAEIDIRLG